MGETIPENQPLGEPRFSSKESRDEQIQVELDLLHRMGSKRREAWKTDD